MKKMKYVTKNNKGKIPYMLRITLVLSVLLIVMNFIPPISGQNYDLSSEPKGTIQFTHPNMYLNNNEIETIKEKIRSNQQPWRSAYDKFMSTDVSEAMDAQIQSVTFGGPNHPSGDQHYYWSDTPYTSDGVFDPNADRTDYYAAIKLGKSVRALGLAYALTGESKYADKAIKLINGWTIDDSTKMYTKVTKYETFIEIRITMPGVFYGADLIWNYPNWKSSDKDAFKEWTRDMMQSVKDYQTPGNEERFNHWRFLFLASGAIITEDSDTLQNVFDQWKPHLSESMKTTGEIYPESQRTRGLAYSLYALNGMMQIAEIARHYGRDFYSYQTSDGKGLEKAFDFHAKYSPYGNAQEVWPYKEIRPDLVEYALYEIAYSQYKKSTYKDIIVKIGRPMYEKRNMGPITLTHADSNLGIVNPTIGPTVGPTSSPTDNPTFTTLESGNIKINCYKKRRAE